MKGLRLDSRSSPKSVLLRMCPNPRYLPALQSV